MDHFFSLLQTLENIKRKQVEKYHKASEEKKEEIECNPYTIFHQALDNCKPVVGLASIQRGGKFYQASTWPEQPPSSITDENQVSWCSVWSPTPLRCPSLSLRRGDASLQWNGWSTSAGRTNTDVHTWMRNFRRSCWQHLQMRAMLSRRSMKCTRWLKPTGRTLTTAGGRAKLKRVLNSDFLSELMGFTCWPWWIHGLFTGLVLKVLL